MEQQSRLVTGIELLTREHEPTSILALVFHADPIRLVLAFFLGMPLDYFQRLGCAPGSVSIVAVNETGAFLHGLNLLPPFTMPSAPRRRGRRRKSA
jgi:probable phosphoglycerate mutase